MKVVLINHVTLDGVMQAPGRADEDSRDGFEHGGWSQPYGDAVMGRAMGARMAEGAALLLGRRTYEDFAGYWPKQKDNHITEVLDNVQKYVASTTLHEPLPWTNSTLLKGDAADAVATLKEEGGPDLHILGSGTLAQSLMRRDLIDEFLLTIHPLILGKGCRLFADGGAYASLELVSAETTTTGVVIATYHRRAN